MTLTVCSLQGSSLLAFHKNKTEEDSFPC